LPYPRGVTSGVTIGEPKHQRATSRGSAYAVFIGHQLNSTAEEIQVLEDGGHDKVSTTCTLTDSPRSASGCQRRPQPEQSQLRPAVPRALREFVARHEQRRLVELFRSLDWDPTYDYKVERTRWVDLFVDTSVWSLALRRDTVAHAPTVEWLRARLTSSGSVYPTGLVLEEVLQGLHRPKHREAIIDRFAAPPLLVPDRADHVVDAEIRITCRRHGVQVGTIVAFLARLSLRHEIVMLSTDRDSGLMAQYVDLRVWAPSTDPFPQRALPGGTQGCHPGPPRDERPGPRRAPGNRLALKE
jgi:predicted nucleic acid-binding protein